MDLFVFWFLLAVAVGWWASNRGRSGFGWFLLSMVLSPLLGGVFLAVSKDLAPQTMPDGTPQPTPDTHVKCPDCRELVLRDARKCKHCGTALTPQ